MVKRFKKRDLTFLAAAVIVIAVGVGSFFLLQDAGLISPARTTATAPASAGETASGGAEVATSGEEVKTLPDGTRYTIHPSNILSGGPPKGGIGVDRGIPAIVNPKFVSVAEADQFLDNDDIVFGVVVNGEVRAYTKEALVFHEIVNDKFGDQPVLVTYCPLCGTAIAFDPTIDGEAVRFGTSGKLYNSNLVMYDEKTDSYWTQVGGRAVVGPLTGMKLKQIPIDTMLYSDWKGLYPDSKILSRDTGFARPYGTDPYGDYYTDEFVGFGVTFTDKRLHPKTMVAGIEINGTSKAYPVPEVDKAGVVNDEFNGVQLLVTKDPSIEIAPEVNPVQIFNRKFEGQVLEFEIVGGKLVDKQTGTEWDFNTGEGLSGENAGKKLSRIIRESDMWFSWVAFHPDTELFIA